jgi:hypothetical protein
MSYFALVASDEVHAMTLTIMQQIAMATMTRAMQLSRGVVKDHLKRERIRLADVDAREVSERARDYLIAHPEVVAEAKACCREWFARGVFGKRAQRAFCAKLESDAQRTEA